MEPEKKHDSPFQRKNNMPANKSIQARQQLRDPNTGRFRDEHRQSGMPTDESIRKYEQQPRPPLPPTTEVPLPPAKARQASSRTIPVDGRPGSTLTVQDVPDQTHGMKRHTQFQSPTTSIRLETPISKISTSRRWKRSPTIWRHGEPVPMRNVANTMRRSRGWRHPEPD